MKTPTQNLLSDIEDFLLASGMTPSRFGINAAGDPKLVWELRKGKRELRFGTMQRIKTFIEAQSSAESAA